MSARYLMLFVPLLVAAGSMANEIRRNPFQQPDYVRESLSSPQGALSSSTDGLLLSAILLDGNRSLVNVAGTIVGIGDQAFGFVLKSVTEESAVFVRDEEELVVSLRTREDRRGDADGQR